MRTLRAATLSAAALLPLAGCRTLPLPTPQGHEAHVAQVAAANTQRETLALIPPPSKNRFMAVRSFDSWMNPYLTVQDSMIQLHVTLADENPSTFGAGGMLRPVAARQQTLSISPDKLGDAMVAIPQTAWPYGRVIAIEEAHKTPKSAEPAVRRTIESTIATLNDLGIVVYDPTEGTIR